MVLLDFLVSLLFLFLSDLREKNLLQLPLLTTAAQKSNRTNGINITRAVNPAPLWPIEYIRLTKSHVLPTLVGLPTTGNSSSNSCDLLQQVPGRQLACYFTFLTEYQVMPHYEKKLGWWIACKCFSSYKTEMGGIFLHEYNFAHQYNLFITLKSIHVNGWPSWCALLLSMEPALLLLGSV